jgi:hypothetical protein
MAVQCDAPLVAQLDPECHRGRFFRCAARVSHAGLFAPTRRLRSRLVGRIYRQLQAVWVALTRPAVRKSQNLWRSIVVDFVVVQIDIRGSTDIDADRVIHDLTPIVAQPANRNGLVTIPGRTGKLGRCVFARCQLVSQPIGRPTAAIIGVDANDDIAPRVVVNLEIALGPSPLRQRHRGKSAKRQ